MSSRRRPGSIRPARACRDSGTSLAIDDGKKIAIELLPARRRAAAPDIWFCCFDPKEIV